MESEFKESGQLKLVDSHAHLDMPEFDSDRHDVIERAWDGGIKAILCPIEITDPKSVNLGLELAERYPNIIAAAGVHPHQAKNFSPAAETAIRRLAHSGAIHALGEIGLDFHYNFSLRDEQIQVFRHQLRIAQDLDLPVIIHSRLAAQEILDALDCEAFTQGGVLHCFTENRNFAEKMLDQDFYISFSGIITFPRAKDIQETAQHIPLNRIMVETDAPFLAPVPFRGKVKRNEPVFVKETARFLAELKDVSLFELSDRTCENFMNCFGFVIPNY
jgi:TatD DNase family protein